MAVNNRPKRKHQQQSFRSLADLGGLSGFSGDRPNDAPEPLFATAASVQAADSNSAHVVVTLGAEPTPDQTPAAVAATPVSQPEPLKEESTMNAQFAQQGNTQAQDVEVKPTQQPAPAAPVQAQQAATGGLKFFSPDFDFAADLGAASSRIHELGGAVGQLDGRMTDAERRIANLESRRTGTGNSTMTVSEDQSWEHTGIKIATAAAVGAAVYTGVRLAQMAFGDSPSE